MNIQQAAALNNIVRIGTVSTVDIGKRLARVTFHDKQDDAGKPLVSGWLKVVQNQPFIPDHNTTQETQPREGGSGEKAYESHTHELIIKPWLPHVDQLVLCIYLPNGGSDGFVIGGI